MALRICALAIFAALIFAMPHDANAGSVAPQDVRIVDGSIAESLTDTPGNADEGRRVFANRKQGNCLACHVNSDMPEQQFHGEIAPPIDGVAGRYEPAQLRAILVNSKAVLGDATVMPGFYRVDGLARVAGKFKGKTILSAQQVEDVLAYLLTLKEE